MFKLESTHHSKHWSFFFPVPISAHSEILSL